MKLLFLWVSAQPYSFGKAAGPTLLVCSTQCIMEIKVEAIYTIYDHTNAFRACVVL